MKTSRPDQPPAPDWEPTPTGTVRDPQAMEDTPSQIWGPDDTNDE
ncbi:hypothetical protein [Streptomyces tauricus]